MKNLTSLTLILGITVGTFLSSCSSDDSDPTVGGGSITFDGTARNLVDGLVADYGPARPSDESTSDTHYNFDFTIVDVQFQQVTEDGETYYSAQNANFGVYVELFSPGTSGFQAGTFNFVEEDPVTEDPSLADIDGKSFFTYADVYIGTGATDSDGDPIFEEHSATGGSVVVTGSGQTNYTLTYNLQFSGGRTLVGSYAGSFKYEDETN